MRFRLFRFRSPLLSESLLISFPPGTEMFQFPGCASYPYVFRVRFPCTHGRVSSFGYPRITAWLTAPRGFSQPPTSFIARFSQGIHTMRYVTFSCSIVRKSPTNRILTDNRLTVENVSFHHSCCSLIACVIVVCRRHDLTLHTLITLPSCVVGRRD